MIIYRRHSAAQTNQGSGRLDLEIVPHVAADDLFAARLVLANVV
ncbi:MAG: hypothetical protein ACTHM2_03390 [Afipia sp.]|jgi:hypothetical protein